MQMYNSLAAQNNTQMQNIYNQSAARRSSINSLNDFGNRIRNSMGGGSTGGGGARITFDDNAPGKGR